MRRVLVCNFEQVFKENSRGRGFAGKPHLIYTNQFKCGQENKKYVEAFTGS